MLGYGIAIGLGISMLVSLYYARLLHSVSRELSHARVEEYREGFERGWEARNQLGVMTGEPGVMPEDTFDYAGTSVLEFGGQTPVTKGEDDE